MPQLQFPLVNGVRYDWSSQETNIDGKKYLGLEELSYSDGLEPGDVYGTHAQAIGRTRGQYKPEASMTMYKAEFDDLMKKLGKGAYEKSFDISNSYSESGQTITDRIVGARIKKVENAGSSGSDPAKVKVDLHVMKIIWNGIEPINNML